MNWQNFKSDKVNKSCVSEEVVIFLSSIVIEGARTLFQFLSAY